MARSQVGQSVAYGKRVPNRQGAGCFDEGLSAELRPRQNLTPPHRLVIMSRVQALEPFDGETAAGVGIASLATSHRARVLRADVANMLERETAGWQCSLFGSFALQSSYRMLLGGNIIRRSSP
jgi:hypothetical protein